MGISRSNKIGAARTWTPDGVHVRCSPIFSLGLSVTLNLLCRNQFSSAGINSAVPELIQQGRK